MRKWAIGILVLAVLVTLFILLTLGQNGSAIFLLLAIIFYGLFANPMQQIHPGRPTRSEKKKTREGSILINGPFHPWFMRTPASRTNRPLSEVDARLHGFFLFIATVFVAWIVLNSQSMLGTENANTGLLSYGARVSGGQTFGTTNSAPTVAQEWMWTALDGLREAAVGNNGSSAIAGYYGNTTTSAAELHLFNLPGNGNPSMTRLVPTTVYLSQNTRVSAAKSADVLARVVTEKPSFSSTTSALKIQKFSSGSGQPDHLDWEYSLPGGITSGIYQFNLRTSDAGKIVALLPNGSNNKGVVFTPGNTTGIPDTTFTHSGFTLSTGTALSGDGRWFATVHGGFFYIYDLLPATPTSSMFSIFNFSGTSLGNQNTCLSFSQDGSVLAIGTRYFNAANPGKILLYERNTQNQYASVRTISLNGTQSCDALVVSPDGKRLAIVGTGYTNPISENTVAVQSYRRTGTSWGNAPSVSVAYSIPPGPTYTNVATSLSMDATGKRFAVGLTGNGIAPEAHVFDSALNTHQPIWSADLPGSVYQVEITPNGDGILVANRTVHVNEPAGSSQVRFYTFG